MAKSTKSVILVTRNDNDRPIFEAKADAGITPGMALKITATGVALQNATIGTAIPLLFADVNPYITPTVGLTPTAAIDTAYTTGQTTRYFYAQPGDIVNVILTDGESASVGSALGVTAGKMVVVADPATNNIQVIGFATEAAAPSGADGRVKMLVR